MPCYVKFHSREVLSCIPGIVLDGPQHVRDSVVSDVINEPMHEFLDGNYHRVSCEPFSERFSFESWNWHKRWVAEWSLDGVHPIQEVQEVPTISLDEPN